MRTDGGDSEKKEKENEIMKRRGRQFFACMLAFSMLFQQSGFQVLAEEQTELLTEAEPQESPEEIPEVNEEPQEDPAEEPVEEPKDEEPEVNPGEPVEATPIPEVSEAPEVTVTPSTPDITETSEATEVPKVTDTPEVTEAPEVSPTETPAPGKTDFHFENNQVVINATAAPEANFPEDTQLLADYLDPASEAYKNAVAVIEAQLGTQLTGGASDITLDYILYDVYFWSDTAGGRLEPEDGSVKVEMNFVKPVDMETKNPETQEQNYNVVKNEVVHVKQDGQAEIIDNAVIQTANDQITAAEFTQDSFSVMGLAWAKESAREAGDVAWVNDLKMSDSATEGADGILDGTGPWDGNDERGNDSSAGNKRVRSYDTVKYNVDVAVQSHDSTKKYESGRVGYRFTIPNDPELKLDQSAMGWAKDWKEETVGENKVYTMYRELPVTNGVAIPGGCTVEFVLNVGGKSEGYEIIPTIEAWAEGNDKVQTVTPQKVTVTSVPKYNVVLKGRDISAKNTYTFDKGYNESAGTVTGYKVDYGFTVQIRNDNLDRGIKGTENPAPGQPVRFDIELSSSFIQDSDKIETDITNEFMPLLYKVNGNGFDGLSSQNVNNEVVWTIPLTWMRSGYDGKVCYKPGTCTITQAENILHVEISNFDIDKDSFPKSNVNGSETYVHSDGKMLAGCFTAFAFSVIQPFSVKDGDGNITTIASRFNNEDGSVNIKAKDVNMSVTSAGGTVVTDQTKTDDDEVSFGRPLRSAGNYHQEIFYSKPGSITDGTSGSNKNDGSDSAVMGSSLAFSIGYGENDVGSADLENHTIAFDQLVKFDDCAFDVGDILYLGANNGENDDWKCQVQYVGKAGGWDHSSGDYDGEMKAAKEKDLSYYDSLGELQGAGMKCVGMLFKFRGCNTDMTKSEFLRMAQVGIRVKTDDSLIKTVAMITESTNAWRVSDLNEADVRAALGRGNEEELTLQDYKNYAQGSFDETKVTPSINMDPDNTYVKAEYTEAGYQANDTKGFDKGDSLYIVPYQASISKQVEQTGDNGRKQNFDIDNGQRFVDFALASKLEFQQDTSVDKPDWTTTVTIVDTLPKGLTYVEGSGFLSGIYKEQTPNPGSVTEGTALTPQVTVNEDGTTTLVWTLENVKVQNGDLPQIHYSCAIGDRLNPANDVVNSQTMETSAAISTTEDHRVQKKENGNVSTAAIGIVKLKSFNISKTGTDSIEIDGTGSFDLAVNNSAERAKENLYAIDAMPQDNVNGTVMKGAYKLTSLTLDIAALGGAEKAQDVEIYYTDDSVYAGATTADVSLEMVKGWTKATLNTETGEITGGLIGTWPVAFAFVDASLEGMKTAHLVLTYQADKGKADDRLINYLSEETLLTTATSDVYSRSLDGIAWLDQDKNGGYEEGENLLENVTAELYKKNASGEWGFYDKTTTDENGYYRFDELPAGDFQIIFKDENGNIFKDRDVTKKEAEGIDTSKNSKAESNKEENSGKFTEATISQIKMPTIEEIKATGKMHYHLPDLNVGLVEESALKAETTPGEGKTVKPGDEITYNITGYNYNSFASLMKITDKLDENVEFVDADQGGICENGVVTWNVKVPAHTMAMVILKVKVKAGAAVEVKNTASVSVGNDTAIETNEIINPMYKRSLSGTAWYDADKNGLLEAEKEDQVLANVTVTLYKQDGQGNWEKIAETLTDDLGNYRFDDLDAGMYKVEFTSSKNQSLKDYKLTKKDAEGEKDGDLVKNNSKAASGETEEKHLKGVIENIEMPSDEKMKADGKTEYHLPYQNAGFIDPKPVKAETVPGENKTAEVGDEISYTIMGYNYNTETAQIVITDTLDPGVDFVSAGEGVNAGAYDKATHTVTWTLEKVAAHTEVTVTLTVKVNNQAGKEGKVDNLAGVKVGNDKEVKTNIITNPVSYKRSLEGTAWLDENKDGRRDENEKLLKDVPVTLYKVNEDGTRTEAGTTTTDENGHYKFNNLEPGNYEVEFTTSENVPFDDLKATKKEAAEEGVNSKIDAGTDENGVLKGIITKITLPTDDELKEQGISEYNKPYQDAGFKEYHPVKAETTPGADQAVKAGEEITYTITGENYNATEADVVITDKLDAGVDFVSAGDGENAGVYDKKAHTVTWTLKNVAAHTEVTVTLKVRVNIDAAAAGKVVNQAGVKVGNDAEVKTNVIENPVTPNEKGTGSITVEKLVKQNDNYLALEEYSFYTALFSDEALTRRASDVKELKVKQSYKASAAFADLSLNTTYYVAETDADGNAISAGDGVIENIEVKNQKIELTPEKATAKSVIINTVAGFPDNYYNDGTVTVNKKVLVNKKETNVTDTFWFTIFADEEMTIPVTTMSLDLKEESSGQLVISHVPYGTFYFAETDKDGVPVGDDYEYTAQVSATEFTLTAENKNAVVNVVNSKEVEEITPSATPEITPTTAPSGSGNTGTSTGVKTGDDTPIALYVMWLLVAILVIEEVIRRRRKMNK